MTKDKLREELRAALAGWQAALNAHEDGKAETIEPARVKLRAAAGRAGIPVQERPKRAPIRPAEARETSRLGQTGERADALNTRPGAANERQEGGKRE